MRHAVRGCLFALSLVACEPVRAADTPDSEQFEDKCLTRAAERAARANKSDRAVWMRELEAAFPGKVADARTEEEYATWYDLLVGKNEEWKRDAGNAQLAGLFDKVVQRLELGPVPTIKREEFAKYARRVLREGNPETDRDANEDADKAFRVLDKDGNGELEGDEMTAALKEEKTKTDADSNGRISKTEYRDYFRRKVAVRAEAIAAKSGDQGRGPNGKPGAANGKGANGLPDWFTALDLDKDGQVSLFEWRKGGKEMAAFTAMDLNGDGLLTRDEYLRYVRLKQIDDAQKQREEAQKP